MSCNQYHTLAVIKLYSLIYVYEFSEDNPIPDEMDIPFRRFCVVCLYQVLYSILWNPNMSWNNKACIVARYQMKNYSCTYVLCMSNDGEVCLSVKCCFTPQHFQLLKEWSSFISWFNYRILINQFRTCSKKWNFLFNSIKVTKQSPVPVERIKDDVMMVYDKVIREKISFLPWISCTAFVHVFSN